MNLLEMKLLAANRLQRAAVLSQRYVADLADLARSPQVQELERLVVTGEANQTALIQTTVPLGRERFGSGKTVSEA
jgi:hypothetical protein